MENEIINRVAQSKLVTIDLEDFYPSGKRILFDISQWLLEGIILKESDFRASVKEHDWSQYNNTYVALYCSTDAIIPSWAFMLVASHLAPFAKEIITGDLKSIETVLYTRIVSEIDIAPFDNIPVIIKGCSNKPIPPSAYSMLIKRLQPVAKSIMFGEACSSVPLYKRR
ncbi:hypothetical protein ULMS_02090 [Patiriisocius marinistellae]|uniref:DUF2480 family protein n=1 Tax=Patiriisocius marinistellae TaxID=2494560 RepID=A0A5J4FYE9_9FLAO|nr:DUF2480 family protein [Patiriisocius marinistellae]GEQ84701.1 hypothetical protein ULMS_02090 [Patiriisocius marinistellae]